MLFGDHDDDHTDNDDRDDDDDDDDNSDYFTSEVVGATVVTVRRK